MLLHPFAFPVFRSSMHRKGVLGELMEAPFTATPASYSNSKLAMVMTSYELQRRLREAGGVRTCVLFVSLHQGVMW